MGRKNDLPGENDEHTERGGRNGDGVDQDRFAITFKSLPVKKNNV